MCAAELSLAVEWAAQEGWNPGLHDAQTFWLADTEGFLIGLRQQIPAAVISAVRYGDDYGFIGFYMVHPSCRGQGLGWAIWQCALDRFRGRIIGLDGVLAQQENYRRSGFELAHRNIRYEGRVGSGSLRARRLMEGDQVDAEQLMTYDRDFFPAARTDFLRAWISQPAGLTLAAVENGSMLGYAVARPCRMGFKIGPLFADCPRVAEELLHGVLAGLPEGAPFYLDIPACNPAAQRLAEKMNMNAVFETARMYRGKVPDLALSRTYGITSFELG